MKLAELGIDGLRRRLRREGLWLRTGPLVCHVRTPFREVAESILHDYADFPLADDTRFADVHLRVRPPAGLRRWIRPQCLCECDGELAFKPHPRRLAPPILEWGLNWCIAGAAHQYLMIHAAVLERDGRALVLSAKAEAGKSTLCAALALSGWRLFSDEIAMVRPADGHLVPLARPVSLKNESIDVVRRFSGEADLGRVYADPVRGSVAHLRAPAESAARMDETSPPGWIVFPSFEPGAPTQSRPMPKGVALVRLADNSFNYSLLGARGFETLAGAVDRCQCLKFRYSRLEEAVAWFDRLRTRGAAGGAEAGP